MQEVLCAPEHAGYLTQNLGGLHTGKFQVALAGQGVDMDMDEVECLVANLIFRGYVKGYLSHRHHVAVLSKNDAFPALTAAMLSDPQV